MVLFTQEKWSALCNLENQVNAGNEIFPLHQFIEEREAPVCQPFSFTLSSHLICSFFPMLFHSAWLFPASGYCISQHLHPSPINNATEEVETNCSSSMLRFCRNIFSSLFITHLNSLHYLKFHCKIAVPIFQKFIIACGTFSLVSLYCVYNSVALWNVHLSSEARN